MAVFNLTVSPSISSTVIRMSDLSLSDMLSQGGRSSDELNSSLLRLITRIENIQTYDNNALPGTVERNMRQLRLTSDSSTNQSDTVSEATRSLQSLSLASLESCDRRFSRLTLVNPHMWQACQLSHMLSCLSVSNENTTGT